MKTDVLESCAGLRGRHWRLSCCLSGWLLALAAAATTTQAAGNPQTALKAGDLDPAAFTQWVDGGGQPADPAEGGPARALWTSDAEADHRGVTFGESARPGPRHLRIGLKTAAAAGSVIVRGGGRLSVLKADAAYPGDLARETDWTPAEWIKNGAVSTDEVGDDEYAVWTLPPGTTTRALRFTHEAQASDARYGGWLGGALILAARVANIAPLAQVAASARDEAAGTVINEKDEGWKAWDNGRDGAAQPVSATHPEWLLLAWPRAVALCGMEALWAGFGSAEVQVYAGPANKHPREAGEGAWKTLQSFGKVENGYPAALWPNALDFGRTITTRAVRLRLTSAARESHPHLQGKTRQGRRVWLGELMALQPLGDAGLKTALPPPADAAPHPPIPVRFTLEGPGYVTLVIEDASGRRVRNLVAETRFPAGPNVAWWDGCDDAGRDLDAAHHGLYHIPEQPVAPGGYHVRGLVHAGLELRYEFSIYSAGNPPWETIDKTGGWLTNHTPPQAALFVPGDKAPGGKPLVYLGSAVSEGGAGLAWVDPEGRKLGGRGWIGGNWTAAPTLARDAGAKAAPGVFAYVGAVWSAGADNHDLTHGELRITALTADGDKPVLKHPLPAPPPPENAPSDDTNWIEQLGGIAVRDGLLVASLPKRGSLLFVDANAGKVLGEAAVESPHGLAFDSGGRLLVLAGTKLLRFALDRGHPAKLDVPQMLAAHGLDEPQGITTDAAGNLYVSDQGQSQQVKVFTPEGGFLRAIGRAGAPKAGPYDPLHMNHPQGLAIDEQDQLWVAENDFQPKRVSVWTLEGKLIRAFYGPGRYGGGGTLDPRDKTRFYYDGMEFKLDWEAGTSQPVAVFSRPGPNEASLRIRAAPPETPIYHEGRQYLTNCFNGNPTGGSAIAVIWLLKDHVAAPVAALGRARDWPLLADARFRSRWPRGVDVTGDADKNAALFVWSDLNGDGAAQPEEVTMIKAAAGGATVMPDLAFVESRVDDKARRFAPLRFTPGGVPIYELGGGETLAGGAQKPASSGGDQALVGPDGWSILTVAPRPWAREGFGGVRNGAALWSYPSLWPGLHASHEAPVPDAARPGEVIGSTRLLGGWITPPRPSDAGPLWCVNGNMGNAYLFTADGLFVAQLFQDSRTGKPWVMPQAERGMLLNDVTLHDENFFPTITQTSDGRVYLCDGSRMSLVRVDGLETIRRLPPSELRVSAEDLQRAAAWRVRAEAQRQAERGSGTLRIALRAAAPRIDGALADWTGADWAVIDRRGTAANFDSNSKPYEVTGAVAVAAGRLYAVFRTQDADLLANSGETPDAPFKTGGALDLMLGADPAADPKRAQPAPGDERLLVTRVRGKTFARLYHAVVPGTKQPAAFSSPWRTITIDRVEDVSAQVQLTSAADQSGTDTVYGFSIPLGVLGLAPAAGQAIKADLGILRGNGAQTLQRVYWNNKATAITADVPSEAELTPGLWGKWLFQAAP